MKQFNNYEAPVAEVIEIRAYQNVMDGSMIEEEGSW